MEQNWCSVVQSGSDQAGAAAPPHPDPAAAATAAATTHGGGAACEPAQPVAADQVPAAEGGAAGGMGTAAPQAHAVIAQCGGAIGAEPLQPGWACAGACATPTPTSCGENLASCGLEQRGGGNDFGSVEQLISGMSHLSGPMGANAPPPNGLSRLSPACNHHP